MTETARDAGIACSISRQAIRLHAYGVIASILAGSHGVIGHAVSEELARASGALVDELVAIGLWVETDLAYVVRAGALAAVLDDGDPVSPRD